MRSKKSFWHKSKLVNAVAILILGIFAWNFFTHIFTETPTEASQTVETPVAVVDKPTELTDQEKEDLTFKLINEERVKHGVKPLIRFEPLNVSSQRKANSIAAEEHYSHVDKNGVHGIDYIFEETDKCSIGSENLVRNIDVEQSIKAWMGSKSHREAILDERYVYTGVGISGTYLVQHFCEP